MELHVLHNFFLILSLKSDFTYLDWAEIDAETMKE